MLADNMGLDETQTWKFDHVWYQTKQTLARSVSAQTADCSVQIAGWRMPYYLVLG